MPVFEKDVLYPGSWQPPGFDKPIHFTAADSPAGVTPDGSLSVPFLGRRMQEMLAGGLEIPVAWEHQDKAKPLTQAERDERKAELQKLTLGHVEAGQLAPEGFLTARLQIPNQEDAKRLPAVRFSSPEITWDYRDGTGKVWPGPSITHVAATSRPVQHRQKPFRQVAMSTLRLSLSDYQDDKGDGDGEDYDTTKSGGDGKIAKAIECLSRLGLILGKDTTPENFIDRLIVAMETKNAQGTTGTEQQVGENDVDIPAGVALSLNKITDAALKADLEKQIKLSLDSAAAGQTDPQTEGIKKNALIRERKDLGARLNALRDTGRINRALHEKLATELKTIPLSLAPDGNVAPNSLSARIEAYEALDPDTAWPASQTRLSMGERDVAIPEGAGAPVNAKETIDGFFKLTGSR